MYSVWSVVSFPSSIYTFYFCHDGINIGAQPVDLFNRGLDLGIELGNINHLAGVFGLHIGADGEVVVIFGNLAVVHVFGDVFDLFLALEDGHDLFDVLVGQHIVVGFLLEKIFAAGVNELGTGVAFVFG